MSLGKGIGYAGQGAAAGAAVGGPIGAAVGGLGGLIGGLFSSDGSEEALAEQKKGLAAIEALQIPELDKALLLQQFQENGKLTPELLEKLNLNADKQSTMTEDPQNRANQQAALNALKQLSQTGMSAQDRAQMAELQSAT